MSEQNSMLLLGNSVEQELSPREEFLHRMTEVFNIGGAVEWRPYKPSTPYLLHMYDNYIKVDGEVHGPGPLDETEYVGRRLRLECEAENEFRTSRYDAI